MLTRANSIHWLNLIVVMWSGIHTNTHMYADTHTHHAYPSSGGTLFEVTWGLCQLVFICQWRHGSSVARKPLRHRTHVVLFLAPVCSSPTRTSPPWLRFQACTLNTVKILLTRQSCFFWPQFNNSWKSVKTKIISCLASIKCYSDIKAKKQKRCEPV